MMSDENPGWWHFAMGLAPDGWVVLFATNGDEADEEILARGLKNAPRRHVDLETVRVAHIETATAEEQAIFDNYCDVLLIKLEARRLARAAGEPVEDW